MLPVSTVLIGQDEPQGLSLRRGRLAHKPPTRRGESNPMDDIYREYILDHYRDPRNHGHLEHPTIAAADTNPLCGDRIEIDLNVTDDGRVSEVRFSGRGCAISQASASMLTERIEGATLDELRAITPDDVLEMLGVPIGPARQRCALLSLRVLHEGIGGPYTGHLDDEDDLDSDA